MHHHRRPCRRPISSWPAALLPGLLLAAAIVGGGAAGAGVTADEADPVVQVDVAPAR